MSLPVAIPVAPVAGLKAEMVGGVVSAGGVGALSEKVVSENFRDSTPVRLKVKWAPLPLAPETTIIPVASAAPIVKFVLINVE